MVQSKKLIIINSIGTLGYIFCLLQWLWAGLLYAPLIATTSVIDQMLPQPTREVTPVETASEPSAALLLIVAAITTAVIFITIIVLLRLPKAIGQTGQKVTQRTATAVLPVMMHHQRLPAAQQKRLRLTVSFLFKVILTVLPVTAGLFVPIETLPFNSAVLWAVALFLAALTSLLFGLQYLLVRLGKLDSADVW